MPVHRHHPSRLDQKIAAKQAEVRRWLRIVGDYDFDALGGLVL